MKTAQGAKRLGWNKADLRAVTRHHRRLWKQLIGKPKSGVTIESMMPGFALSLQLLFDQGYNLTDVGAMFGVTRERVRQWVAQYSCKQFPVKTAPRIWSDRQRCFLAVPETRSALAARLLRQRTQRRRQCVLDELQERFWNMVAPTSLDGCWHWTGAIQEPAPWNYGVFRGKYAHRLAYLWNYGSIEKPCIAHSCDTADCVNPQHLWEATYAENTQDSVRKGRWHALHQGVYRRREHCRSGNHVLAETRHPKWGYCRACKAEYDQAYHRRPRPGASYARQEAS